MHTRRAATFLLGAWIAGCLFMAYVAINNLDSTGAVVQTKLPGAARIVQSLGEEPARLLLRHHSAEINRGLFRTWEKAQAAIALLLFLSLFLGTDRRVFPMLLCVVMFAMVAFQFVGIDKELAYRGRETDFPPGNTDFSAQQRAWTLHQIYVTVEGVKIVAGLVLTGYLFVFRARRKRRKEDPIIDQVDARAV